MASWPSEYHNATKIKVTTSLNYYVSPSAAVPIGILHMYDTVSVEYDSENDVMKITSPFDVAGMYIKYPDDEIDIGSSVIIVSSSSSDNNNDTSDDEDNGTITVPDEWLDGQHSITNYVVIDGSIEYYLDVTSSLNKPFGRLPAGTIISTTYDSIKNAMVIINCVSYPASIGKYIKSLKNASGKTVLYMYNNWSDEQQDASGYILTDHVNFYTMANGIFQYAGRLYPGDSITLQYNAGLGAMEILSWVPGNGPSANNVVPIGKYILSPVNSDGETLLEIDDSVTDTTEATTTTDTYTGIEVPMNTDSNGNTSGSNASVNSEITDMEAFLGTVASITYTTSKTYRDNLESGLRVKDLRGILGMPHQFSPLTDPRIDSDTSIGFNDGFGRVYSEKIIKNIPLLLMTPGIPTFMSKFSDEQKNKILGKLANWTMETLESIIGDDKGKYYSLKYAYTDYFNYVNAMLRSAAYYLEIQNETVDGEELGTLNWLYSTARDSEGSGVYSHGGLSSFLGPHAGAIAFYADAGTSIDESFTNTTTESQLSSGLNSLSDTARELNFLIGNVGSLAGINLDLLGTNNIDDTIYDLQSNIDGILGGGNILGNILGKAENLLAGGRLLFPEIWSDSSFSRSYSCSMKLISPSGDKLSVFLNILVPIYHLLGFTLPREATNQAYFSPFLVRAYYKGLFNVDMGIITGLSITKGDEGEWTLDGIPTVANVSFEIKDLYDGLYMSEFKHDKDYGIMSNTQELDYIANSCGVNVNDQDIWRTIKMYMALGFSSGITDKVTIGIFGEIAQFFNQKIENIFGVY